MKKTCFLVFVFFIRKKNIVYFITLLGAQSFESYYCGKIPNINLTECSISFNFDNYRVRLSVVSRKLRNISKISKLASIIHWSSRLSRENGGEFTSTIKRKGRKLPAVVLIGKNKLKAGVRTLLEWNIWRYSGAKMRYASGNVSMTLSEGAASIN